MPPKYEKIELCRPNRPVKAVWRDDTRGAFGTLVMEMDPMTVTEPGQDRPLTVNLMTKTIIIAYLMLQVCSGWAGTWRVIALTDKTLISHPRAIKSHFEPWNGPGLHLAEVVGTILQLDHIMTHAKSLSQNMHVNLQWYEMARLFSVTLEEHFTDRPSFVETGLILPIEVKHLPIHEYKLRKFLSDNRGKPVTIDQIMHAFDGRLQ